MPEIVPAIIAKDFGELEEKIKLVEGRAKTVQLDVMDGIFVPDSTWPLNLSREAGPAQGRSQISEIDNLDANIFLDAHLMVEYPDRVLSDWLNTKVKRVIFHWEAIEKYPAPQSLISDLATQTHGAGKEFGAALNLETPITALDNFISEIDMVLLMSVKPGSGGQKFEEAVLPKIVGLRQKYPGVKIGVDGGINPRNISKLVEAGADFLVVGSAIFAAGNPAKALEDIKKII